MMIPRRLVLLLAFALCAAAQNRPVLIVLVGAPGSGKTTQAEFLKTTYGLPVVSIEEVVAENASKFQNVKQPTIQGIARRLDPMMNGLVEAKLKSLDLSRGAVLDGYPASKDQADYLVTLAPKLHLPMPLVINLQIPDDVIRKRRANEPAGKTDQQIKDYHREFDFLALYFSGADIHNVDGTLPPAKVSEQVAAIVEKRKKMK